MKRRHFTLSNAIAAIGAAIGVKAERAKGKGPGNNPKNLPVVKFKESLLAIANEKELFEYASNLPENKPMAYEGVLKCRVWVDVPTKNDEDGPWWGETGLEMEYTAFDEWGTDGFFLYRVDESIDFPVAHI